MVRWASYSGATGSPVVKSGGVDDAGVQVRGRIAGVLWVDMGNMAAGGVWGCGGEGDRVHAGCDVSCFTGGAEDHEHVHVGFRTFLSRSYIFQPDGQDTQQTGDSQ